MKINSKQKFVIGIVMALIVVVTLFPPWTYTVKAKSIYSEKPAGYRFIGSPPAPEKTNVYYGIKIDAARLSIQIIAILALMGIGIIAFSGGKKYE